MVNTSRLSCSPVRADAGQATLEDVAAVSGGMLLVRAAAKHSGLSRNRLFSLMESGDLPYAVIDERGTRVIPKLKLDEYVAGLLAATRLATGLARSGKKAT